VCLAVKPVGEPDAVAPHVRFDTGRTCRLQARWPPAHCSFDNACKYSGGRTDEREIEVTSVAQPGSRFFVTKFRDQVTSATVESPEQRYARSAFS